MMCTLFDELGGLPDVAFHREAESHEYDRFVEETGLSLPPKHWEVLRRSDGLEVYAGYYRLFGLYPKEATGAVLWNQPEYWKFAWGGRCADYWCFAETAWGDQYAYSMESLRTGRDETVFLIDAISMTPEVVASSFAGFVEQEFVRSAKDPYDVMIRQVRERFGPLEVTDHLVYIPSILLGGTEDIRHVHKMNARMAMIGHGDMALQLDAGPHEGKIRAVIPYEDSLQRLRLRLVWEQTRREEGR